jgi:hypothetical protein
VGGDYRHRLLFESAGGEPIRKKTIDIQKTEKYSLNHGKKGTPQNRLRSFSTQVHKRYTPHQRIIWSCKLIANKFNRPVGFFFGNNFSLQSLSNIGVGLRFEVRLEIIRCVVYDSSVEGYECLKKRR